ncbi:Eukaryotic translation initiation factor 4E [Trachymyrmex septentrionalis]|uniref:eIF-4F 25 kDa subunit n=1 Tax=Trachymyrmex septentrionalis TaxID=34720 RepID=A0A151JUN6_9HYME|nr:PREDICTED: eukaryotic translation initiation factor 4E-like isoform X1 [Trachymyrmex septentrionalis]KYN36548.1 Eukaryotic translation initiation factor 4E [Trachymyrmex septentrionalis]
MRTQSVVSVVQVSATMHKEIDRKQNTEVASPGEFPPEYLIKHPLQNTWTLWYYEPDRTKTWEESQREITSFDTAEDFWSLYNHIKTASELRQGCDYSMFKQGIRPMWEDDQNKCGGRWLINLDKKQRTTDLDNFWLEILLCMIGEAFNEYSDDICGAVVNVRPKGDKLGVWTSNADCADSVMEIGRKLKERLRITSKTTMGYQVHKDTMVKAGSQTKNTYTL